MQPLVLLAVLWTGWSQGRAWSGKGSVPPHSLSLVSPSLESLREQSHKSDLGCRDPKSQQTAVGCSGCL